MQWSTEPQGGFTKGEKPVLPVISEGPYGFEHVNVAAQRRDPNSLLNWMERMIRMRKEVPEIGWGDFTFLKVDTTQVLAMQYVWRNNVVIVLHNLAAAPCEVLARLRRKNSGDGELKSTCSRTTIVSGPREAVIVFSSNLMAIAGIGWEDSTTS